MKRKLVAILAGDVVGYSRLMGLDEELAVQNWTAYREYIIDVADDHHGRLFNSAGDSVVLEFASVLDALRCAVDVQGFLADVNADVPEDRRMLMRFGLHLSDVVVDRGNYLGDGVNVAARLEALAPPGGICVSDMVHGNLGASPEFAFVDLGDVALKNIARPIRAYRLILNGDAPAVPAVEMAAAPAADDEDWQALAVLPFDNLGGNPDDDYFVDGLTEDIITALAAWRSFPVIARNSTFAYKGKSPDVRAAARELGARYVLEGSIRTGASRVRVNVQFIDAATGHHLWAEKFDRQADDVFDLQDQITDHIAATIAPEVERAERARVAPARPTDMTAWRHCLQGRALLEAFTPAGNGEARDLFEQSVTLDPGYAEGYVGLATSHHRDLLFRSVDDRAGAIAGMLAASRQAVSLDPANSEAHCVLAFAFTWDRQLDRAIASGEEAVRLNPSNAVAFSALGIAQSLVGRPADGIANMERSLKLNPRNPRIHFTIVMVARAYLNARAPEDAARWAETAIQRRADYALAHLVLAAALGHLDRPDAARAALDECERLDPGFARRWALHPLYKNPADDLYFLDGLRRAGLDTSDAGAAG